MIQRARTLLGDDEPTTTALSIDAAAGTLKNPRRRLVLDALRDLPVGHSLDISALADRVAASEYDGEVSADDRKRVYVSLYQSHCPRLDADGVADWNGRSITKTVETQRLTSVLDELRDLTGGQP